MIWPWSSTEKIQEDTKRIQEDIDVLKSGVRAYRRPVSSKAEQRAHAGAVVSSSTVECRRWEDDIHVALLLVYSSGFVEVRCDEKCYDCIYGHCIDT